MPITDMFDASNASIVRTKLALKFFIHLAYIQDIPA